LSERELIGRCSGGEKAAWLELIGRDDPHVRRLLWRRLRNAADVDDLSQEIWARLLANEGALLRGFRGDSFRAYLARMVQSAAIDHVRRGRAEPGLELGAAADVESPEPGPEASLGRARWKAALGRALDRVSAQSASPARDRDLLRLHYEEGFSAAEIAETVALPVDAVESLLRRTRERVHAAAAEEAGALPSQPP
jgi:RNA polymerase sigma-70 factor (ECF subfamily)